MTDDNKSVALVVRLLPAPPGIVYDEWLDAEALSDWMCPLPARATNIYLEPRVGGRLQIDIEENGFSFVVRGRYVELDRPRRLSFTWSCSTWSDPSTETLVTVTFEPHGDSETLMTIQHALLPPDLIDQHRSGWASIAEQLAADLVVAQ